ncbi:MAG: hypothetical protein ACLGHL_06005 [Actinomycetota bacterium]
MMIFKPGGLLAAKRRRVELSEAGAADMVISETVDVDAPVVEQPVTHDEKAVVTEGDDVRSPSEGGEER